MFGGGRGIWDRAQDFLTLSLLAPEGHLGQGRLPGVATLGSPGGLSWEWGSVLSRPSSSWGGRDHQS